MIFAGDLIEAGFGELNWRKALIADFFGGMRQREFDDVRRGHRGQCTPAELGAAKNRREQSLVLI